MPVLAATVVALIMWDWWRGMQLVRARVAKLAVSVPSLVRMMRNSSVNVIPGTAFFQAGDPEVVPSTLLHNIMHNRVLDEQTVLLTVETLRVPCATAEERATVDLLGGCFIRVILRFGFMETPDVSRAIAHARRAGLKFDVMVSTFFLGRRRVVATGSGLELAMDCIYVALARLAADPTDCYHLQRDRVVELGERVAIRPGLPHATGPAQSRERMSRWFTFGVRRRHCLSRKLWQDRRRRSSCGGWARHLDLTIPGAQSHRGNLGGKR